MKWAELIIERVEPKSHFPKKQSLAYVVKTKGNELEAGTTITSMDNKKKLTIVDFHPSYMNEKGLTIVKYKFLGQHDSVIKMKVSTLRDALLLLK